MVDCFHRPEESFSGPWCQDEGIKCQLSVRFIEEWNRLCMSSHAGTSLTRSYRLILCASVCGWPSCSWLSDTSLLVSDWEDGRATAASSCPPWRTLESLSMSNLQEGTSISLLGKIKLIVGREWKITEFQRMGLIITDASFYCLVCVNRHCLSFYIQTFSNLKVCSRHQHIEPLTLTLLPVSRLLTYPSTLNMKHGVKLRASISYVTDLHKAALQHISMWSGPVWRLKSSSSLLQVWLTVVLYAALNRWPPTAWCIVSFISRCEHPVYPFSTSHIYLPELHPILCDCSLVYTVHFSIVVWHAATKNGKSPIWFWFEVHIWLTVWSWVGLWLCDNFLEFFNIDEKK